MRHDMWQRFIRGTVQLFAGASELKGPMHTAEERLSDLLCQRFDLAADR